MRQGFEYLIITVIVLVVISPASISAAVYRAAVLETRLESENRELLQGIEDQIRGADYAVERIDLMGLCKRDYLTAERFDLLVLPDSSTLPARAVDSVGAFLKQGGDILALRAPLWQSSLINVDGKWIDRSDYETQMASIRPEHVVIDFAKSTVNEWTRSTNDEKSQAVYEIESKGPGSGQSALHVRIENLTGWDTFYSPAKAQIFQNEDSLVVFSAKGGKQTTSLSMEIEEADGSRWIAVIALTPKWRRYVLQPSDFRYWISNQKRGQHGDKLRISNGRRVNFGLAHTHTGNVGGEHEYWVGPVGTTSSTGEIREVVNSTNPPDLEGLSPGYKFFTSTQVTNLSLTDAWQAQDSLEGVPETILSSQPRPTSGFSKGRDWRWIPLLQASTKRGDWRGNPAVITAHAEEGWRGGIWASVGIQDPQWYLKPDALTMVRSIAERIRTGVFIIEGGADFYTYNDGQPVRMGARIANFSKETRTLTAEIGMRDPQSGKGSSSVYRWKISLAAGEVKQVEAGWKEQPRMWNRQTCHAEVMDQDGHIVDNSSHSIYQLSSIQTDTDDFVRVKDGEFVLNGKRWKANGVNYMPSSGIGVDARSPWWTGYFENWLGSRSYDTSIVERDLRHVKELGLNAISIFIYNDSIESQNLLDIIRIARDLDLKINLSLRPGTPMNFGTQWPLIKPIIEKYRLWDKSIIFAYDVAWEPSFGTHEERKIWDAEWVQWITDRYGSIDAAEKAWDFAIPRDNGIVTNPLPQHIDSDGDWRVMTAAYRRFLDTLLYRKYGAARRAIRAMTNQLVSFRMSEAGNPNYRWDGRITYDWPYLGAGVDIIEPEAYGRIGDWAKVRPGIFEYEYAKCAAPTRPVMWAEIGVSAWDNSVMRSTQTKLSFQRQYAADFYKMLTDSNADGVMFWWYPGGFRSGENSDYGIINPDGSDRPITKSIRKYGAEFLGTDIRKRPEVWLEFDRDNHPDGIAGIYDNIQEQFWHERAKGNRPRLRTPGSNTTSLNCPLDTVGTSSYKPNQPLKYLDSVFDLVEVRRKDGTWVHVVDGELPGKESERVELRLSITNLAEATWMKDVSLVVSSNKGVESVVAISKVVPKHESIAVQFMIEPISGELVLSMRARGKIAFGDKLILRS